MLQAIILFSVSIFLSITFLGIFYYLGYVFSAWHELSIGGWAGGSFLSSLAIGSYAVSILFASQNNFLYENWFRTATIISYLAFWIFGVSNLIARRGILDSILLAAFSVPLGFILPFVMRDLEVENFGFVVQESTLSGLSNFDVHNMLFFGVLLIIISRDSYLIYLSSLRKKVAHQRKSIALTHLLAWQFWGLGTASLRVLAEFTSSPVYFGLPFILLLVPILTLGSRPFDWAREGHDPLMLLLIDQYGSPAYSWTRVHQTPLLLEGSSIATVNEILENFAQGQVNKMVISFQDSTLYTHSSNGYLSILLTTGYHKSFEYLLGNIHQILVTDVIRQNESGIPGYDFPKELQWLLNQLSPEVDMQASNYHASFLPQVTH